MALMLADPDVHEDITGPGVIAGNFTTFLQHGDIGHAADIQHDPIAFRTGKNLPVKSRHYRRALSPG